MWPLGEVVNVDGFESKGSWIDSHRVQMCFVFEKDVLATLDPNTFLMEPEILIPTLDEQNFISVNNALASVSVQSGSLKSILQVLANQWISVVMPDEDRVLYTTSEKPRPPQTTLPTRFLNSPIELIVKCINVNGVKDSTTSLHVSLFFKLHLSNLFNHSRNSVKQKKRKHRTSEESEHGKDTSGG
ncbi:hypothetical protein CRE_19411 [Caenorhabditis remanei]|uniref:Uncharacterized protein n=1 Tax=Caenorhabditis remanei TaxID=31234 RepID=E3N9Y6_CAERE|nr:hypothetical protein CRE_19411 [Caenorhabditis remanei]